MPSAGPGRREDVDNSGFDPALVVQTVGEVDRRANNDLEVDDICN